ATVARDRGLALCEQGDPAQALLWLACGLELISEGNDVGRIGNPSYNQAARLKDLRWGLLAQLAVWSRYVHTLRMVLPHEGPVYAVAIHPDGKTLLTGSKGWLA